MITNSWSVRICLDRIFSGGHARNWATLSTACVNVLKQVQLHLDEQSGRLFGGSIAAVDNVGGSASGDASDLSDPLKIDREMLLMPVQARRQGTQRLNLLIYFKPRLQEYNTHSQMSINHAISCIDLENI